MAKRGIKEARKDKIIESALEIFADKGFSEATMADISKKAGVSTPVLYEYFKTKEDLLFAIPQKYREGPIQRMEEILLFIREPEEKIRAIIQGYVTFFEENPLYASLVMLHLKNKKKYLNTKGYENSRKMPRLLLQIIQLGIDTGKFKEDTNALLIRSMLLGTIERLCVRKLLFGEPKDLQPFVDPMLDTILNGIKFHPRQTSINVSLSQPDDAKELLEGVLEGIKRPAVKRKKS